MMLCREVEDHVLRDRVLGTVADDARAELAGDRDDLGPRRGRGARFLRASIRDELAGVGVAQEDLHRASRNNRPQPFTRDRSTPATRRLAQIAVDTVS